MTVFSPDRTIMRYYLYQIIGTFFTYLPAYWRSQVLTGIFWARGCLATCDREVLAIYIAGVHLSLPDDIG